MPSKEQIEEKLNFEQRVASKALALEFEISKNGAKGIVKNVQKGAAAIAAEYNRLDALYRVDAKMCYIPHDEKDKLFDMSIELAAYCRVLARNTLQTTNQTQLPGEDEEV